MPRRLTVCRGSSAFSQRTGRWKHRWDSELTHPLWINSGFQFTRSSNPVRCRVIGHALFFARLPVVLKKGHCSADQPFIGGS
jgi:hypothetical protein